MTSATRTLALMSLQVFDKQGMEGVANVANMSKLELSMLGSVASILSKEVFGDLENAEGEQIVLSAAGLWVLGYATAVMDRRDGKQRIKFPVED